jgi:ribosomal protein L40E
MADAESAAGLMTEREFIENAIHQEVICDRCGATLETYADVCTAQLNERCPGFVLIENTLNEIRAIREGENV